jgi:hypothetical protein
LPPLSLYLLGLLLKDLLRLLAQLFDHRWVLDVVGGVAGSHGHDVKFGAGAGRAMSMAVVRANSASSEPSVASRILVGKMLIETLSFPVGGKERDSVPR